MSAYFETNKGVIRENNEDNLIITETDRYNLYVVADGMGGHSAGEVASAIAINVIKEYFDKTNCLEDFKVPRFINESLKNANQKILDEASQREDYLGMGTTVTMAVVDVNENTAYIGNVGDSRTYLVRDKEIKQITEDHTFVQELVRDGRISPDEARKHPKRNIITRAVGSQKNLMVDIFEIELKNGDILLLCSDGLTTHISDKEILDVIIDNGCAESVKQLVKLSNDNGGTDNITIILIDNNYRGDNVL